MDDEDNNRRLPERKNLIGLNRSVNASKTKNPTVTTATTTTSDSAEPSTEKNEKKKKKEPLMKNLLITKLDEDDEREQEKVEKETKKGLEKKKNKEETEKKEKKKPAPEEEAEKKEKKKKEEVEKKEKKKQEEAEKKEKKKQEEAEKKLKKEEGKNTKKVTEKKTKDETKKKKKESKKKGTEKEEHLEEVSSDDDIMSIKTKKPAKEANNDDANDENFVVLVELIQRYGRDPLFNLLSQDTILTFQATQPYKDDGWPDMGKLIGAAYNNKITEIQEYYLSGKGFKKFEKFCKSKYLDAELKCLVAFERLMEKADNYVEFMILYREIWITYLQSGGVNLDGIDILRAVFDACWEDQEKEPKPLSLVDVTSVPKNLKM